MLHVHVHRVLEDLCAVKPVRSFRILSFLFLKIHLPLLKLIICIGVSTNTYKLYEISLMTEINR